MAVLSGERSAVSTDYAKGGLGGGESAEAGRRGSCADRERLMRVMEELSGWGILNVNGWGNWMTIG
jgi:hypothetical protein